MPGAQTAAVRSAPAAAYPEQPATTDRRAARAWLAAARRQGRVFFVAAGLADLLAAAGTVLGCWNIATLIVAWIGPRRPGALGGAIVGVALGALVAALATLIAARLAEAGAVRVESAVRAQLLESLLLGDADERSVTPAVAATAVMDQLPLIGAYFRGYARAAVATVSVPVVILVAVFPASWVVGLLLLVSLPIIPINMVVTGLGATEASRRQMTQIGELSGQVLERLQAASTLRALGAIEPQRRVVERAARELARRTVAVLRIAFLASTALEWVSTFAIGVVAMYTGATLLGYVHAAPLPVHIAPRAAVFVLLLAPEFFLPLRRFAAAYHQGQEAIAAAEVLGPLTETRHATFGAGHSTWTATAPRVELREVSVRYPSRSSAALHDITFTVPSGCVFGVAGSSGSGKSTLLRLAGGWLAPTDGTVQVAQRTPGEGGRALLIAQRPYLFPGTLADNLALGQPGLAASRMWEAIERAQLTRVVRSLPEGLQTVLGERGWGLSAGEAQRISIARAFLSHATFLIVDEPTAHLDRDTERNLIEPLGELLRGRTALVASHSDAVLALADFVITIEDGHVHD
ncbi:MAG: ATP-binding cassette, subfamily bacterial CydD [Pseudonocardiales bacterium]|nr:ATP-binding cassette, subfamily bacterial CydD [Pseudonocardiales bacterium]